MHIVLSNINVNHFYENTIDRSRYIV